MLYTLQKVFERNDESIAVWVEQFRLKCEEYFTVGIHSFFSFFFLAPCWHKLKKVFCCRRPYASSAVSVHTSTNPPPPMAHASLLRQALTDFADRPLLILPDESNIDAGGRWEATPGTVQPQ